MAMTVAPALQQWSKTHVLRTADPGLSLQIARDRVPTIWILGGQKSLIALMQLMQLSVQLFSIGFSINLTTEHWNCMRLLTFLLNQSWKQWMLLLHEQGGQSFCAGIQRYSLPVYRPVQYLFVPFPQCFLDLFSAREMLQNCLHTVSWKTVRIFVLVRCTRPWRIEHQQNHWRVTCRPLKHWKILEKALEIKSVHITSSFRNDSIIVGNHGRFMQIHADSTTCWGCLGSGNSSPKLSRWIET